MGVVARVRNFVNNFGGAVMVEPALRTAFLYHFKARLLDLGTAIPRALSQALPWLLRGRYQLILITKNKRSWANILLTSRGG